jgi:tetratricopeptide (TPR) repeat protein
LDGVCKELELLFNAGQYDQMIKRINVPTACSEESRRYIGRAYLALAASETNTAEQEEAFCRKAIEFGATQGYMGLYFLYAQNDEKRALGFLKQYIETRPADPVPFAILGEKELDERNYAGADKYLRESRRVARSHSARIDWMLFQANYLLGNYAYAAEMLDNALQNGRFDKGLDAVAKDGRFQGITTRPEFRKYREYFVTR